MAAQPARQPQARASFQAGQAVEGLFAGVQWKRATILRDNGDGTCTVVWVDGVAADTVKAAPQLRPAASAASQRPAQPPAAMGLQAGQAVQGLFANGCWYRATVVRNNGDGTYVVAWADGTKADTVKPVSELRPVVAAANGQGHAAAQAPAQAAFRVGEVVEAMFMTGKWYRATIVQSNDDGTYQLAWADGTSTDSVKNAGQLRPLPAAALRGRFPVLLRVYEIGAGAYHAAVEVHGQEWQFGCGGGITCIEPGSADGYCRQLPPVPLGHTKYQQSKVATIIARMRRDWKGSEYNVIHRNCCHFARGFLHELGAQPMPEWVDGWTDKVVPTVEAGVGAIASRGVVLGAEMLVARTVTLSAGPAAWGAAAGDLVGSGIGERVGGQVGGAKGAEAGKEVGSFSGSVALGAGVGACCAGPVGAGIGAGVGVVSWGVGKLVRTAVAELPGAAVSLSASVSNERS